MLVLPWLLGESKGCRTLALTGGRDGENTGDGDWEGEGVTGGGLVGKAVADDMIPPFSGEAKVMGM